MFPTISSAVSKKCRALWQSPKGEATTTILEQSRDDARRVVVPLLLPLCLNVGNRLPALVLVDTGAADVGELPVAHASVQVDVSGADKERSVRGDLEPRPDLPD
jgi:hypothetical protein